MNRPSLKPVVWVGSSLKDLKGLPDQVQDEIGKALLTVQLGFRPPSAKPLSGFGGASVLEIVENFRTDTFRSVYTVRFEDAVYVLHTFQKKSNQGVSTPKAEMNVIQSRLRDAQELAETRRKGGEGQQP